MSTPSDAPYKLLQRECERLLAPRVYTIDREKLVKNVMAARKGVLLIGTQGSLARAAILKLRPLMSREERRDAQVLYLDLPEQPSAPRLSRRRRLALRRAARVIELTNGSTMVVDSGRA